MNSSFLFVKNKCGMVHYVYWGVNGFSFQIKIVGLSLKIDFVLANSVDPNEIPHNAAFLLGFHCLP